MSDIREKPEHIDIPTDPISGPAVIVPRDRPAGKDDAPLGRTTDEPHEDEG